MQATELIEAGQRLYGERWRQPLSDVLGVDIATMRRWTSGRVAVPKPVALAVRLLLERHEKVSA